MKVTDFLKFRDKCRFIISESRRVAGVPMNFYIDDVAIMDIVTLNTDDTRDTLIKCNYSKVVKALSEYKTEFIARIDYLIHGSSNLHYEYIPAKYLLPEYSEEDITKDLMKRLRLADKLDINISEIDDLYALMSVEIQMEVLLILLGVFIALEVLDHIPRTIKREGCIDWKAQGNKIWWEYNTKGWLNFQKKCREARDHSRGYRNGVRKHW